MCAHVAPDAARQHVAERGNASVAPPVLVLVTSHHVLQIRGTGSCPSARQHWPARARQSVISAALLCEARRIHRPAPPSACPWADRCRVTDRTFPVIPRQSHVHVRTAALDRQSAWHEWRRTGPHRDLAGRPCVRAEFLQQHSFTARAYYASARPHRVRLRLGASVPVRRQHLRRSPRRLSPLLQSRQTSRCRSCHR